MTETLTTKEAILHLGIEKKQFENYYQSSGEIVGEKIGGKWVFAKNILDEWKEMKDNRTVFLSRTEYEKCFVFAIQMAYSKSSSTGTGISGVRTEVEQSDNWIFGILAEFGLKKFLKETYGIEIELDTEPHPEEGITAQDIVSVDGNPPGLKVAVKSSKPKSCWNVIDPSEYEKNKRRSDVYVFARVHLPSDHLFRILRDHSFFKRARGLMDKRVKKQDVNISKIRLELEREQKKMERIEYELKELKKIINVKTRKTARKKLNKEKKSTKKEIDDMNEKINKLKVFKRIEPLPKNIPIWICGFSEHRGFHVATEIPGQKFTRLDSSKWESYRYVKSVADMKNSDKDWDDFVGRLAFS